MSPPVFFFHAFFLLFLFTHVGVHIVYIDAQCITAAHLNAT